MVKPLKLSGKEWRHSFELVPRLAINLLLENSRGEILLTRRAIPPQKGSWHYSGGFLMKGEAILGCLKRVAKDELSLEKLPAEPLFAGIFENLTDDPRGHVVDIIYRLKVANALSINPTKQTLEARFFEKLPPKIGFNHKKVLEKLGYK